MADQPITILLQDDPNQPGARVARVTGVGDAAWLSGCGDDDLSALRALVEALAMALDVTGERAVQAEQQATALREQLAAAPAATDVSQMRGALDRLARLAEDRDPEPIPMMDARAFNAWYRQHRKDLADLLVIARPTPTTGPVTVLVGDVPFRRDADGQWWEPAPDGEEWGVGPTLAAALEDRAALVAGAVRIMDERDALVEEMAAVLPEDVGLAEYVRALRRSVEEAERQAAAEAAWAAQQNDRLSRVAEAVGLASYGGAYDPERVVPLVQAVVAAGQAAEARAERRGRALEQAANAFETLAIRHDGEYTDAGNRKAALNRSFARQCRVALADAPAATDEPAPRCLATMPRKVGDPYVCHLPNAHAGAHEAPSKLPGCRVARWSNVGEPDVIGHREVAHVE